MGTRHLLAAAGMLAAAVSYPATASEEPKPWVTTMGAGSNTTLRLHWVHPYEGFDTITRIDALRGGKVVRTFRVSGQPSFNQAKTLIALPDCWHGGCSTEIRVLDLMNLRELPPIRFEREWFFKVSWEDEQLKVVLGAMNPDEQTDIHCFAIPRSSDKPLERTGCGRSAPIR